MTRPAVHRRVSTLVSRFEQFGPTPSIQIDIFNAPAPQTVILRSSSTATSSHSKSRHHERTMSMSGLEASLEQRLNAETRRINKLHSECEDLRRHAQDSEERSALLKKQLDDEVALRQMLKSRAEDFETKVMKLTDKLSHRDEVQRAEYDRRVVAVANERDILASRLRTAEATVENAQAVEKRLRAEKSAQAADERVKAAAAQVDMLRTQLLELKQTVAAKAAGRQSVSDQEIRDSMTTLNHLVQNWVINTFRGVKIDPTQIQSRFKGVKALQGPILLRDLYTTFDMSTKVYALQATVMYLLMRVFKTHFFGLPEDLQGLETAVQTLRSSTTQFSEWRVQTCEYLQRADGSLKKHIEAANKKAQWQLAGEICDAMSDLTGADISDTQSRTLRTVIEHAVTLSRTFSSQLAVYQCVFPDAPESASLSFDATLMENIIDGQENDEECPRDVKCVTCPALFKKGDEKGENMDSKNLIMKAKVLCVARAEDSEEEMEEMDHEAPDDDDLDHEMEEDNFSDRLSPVKECFLAGEVFEPRQRGPTWTSNGLWKRGSK